MHCRPLVSAGILLALGAIARAEAPGPMLDELERKAANIRPTAEESGWRRIPWLTDLAEAQRVAREEHRPIFLFASAFDPLERC
jgi:hypothetical protein